MTERRRIKQRHRQSAGMYVSSSMLIYFTIVGEAIYSIEVSCKL